MDMFLHSTFARGEIDKERNVIKEELAMYLDQPQHHVQELLNQSLWPDQPLGRSLTGTERTLDAMTRAKLVNFQHANYVTGGTLVVVAGNRTHQQVLRAVKRYAPRFPLGKRPRFVPATHDQKEPRLRLFTKATEQTQLALGIRTCSRHDERRFALRLLNTVLGENMSSRLFQIVREDLGLAYSIHSSLCFFDDVGTLVVSAGLDTAKLPEALKRIGREVRRFTETLPGATELRQARDYLVGHIDLGLESTENQMMWLGEQLLGYGKIIAAAELKQRLSEVKAGQIRSVAREFFQPARVSLAVVSPLKSDRGLREQLQRWR